MPDEYAVLLSNFLRDGGLGWDAINKVVLASVVPALTGGFVELSRRYIHVEPVVVSARVNTGNKVDVDQPDQAGADRIANAAAVTRLYGGTDHVVHLGPRHN